MPLRPGSDGIRVQGLAFRIFRIWRLVGFAKWGTSGGRESHGALRQG